MIRDVRLDLLRGAAVGLMVLDHALLVIGGPHVVRLTITRLALPLFMIVAGYLLGQRGGQRPSSRRVLAVGACGVATTTMFHLMGLPTPDVLLTFVAVLMVYPLLSRWPLQLATLGLLQAVNIPIPWTGYQPGYLLLWVGLGVLTFRAGIALPTLRLPSWVAAVGRQPLRWYVGNLAALFVAAVGFGSVPIMGRG